MLSRRSQEGYFQVDHRAEPGSQLDGMPVHFEAATYTCRHCKRVVVLNPLRVRERGYCPKCDHRVCDQCEAARVASGGECRDFEKIVDIVQEAGAKGRPLVISKWR